ncbi:MAG: asparagine synthetase B [Nitrospirales bacterium]|nr:MAG: asparagine synthetase B [Nitrospirales bacterium]
MCGLVGVLHSDGKPVLQPILKEMTDLIRHRGPDGEGQWAEGPVGLGHRRLSIIDLSDAGQQPMHSDDGRYVLVYNGEIYNFLEVRSVLEELGHVFKSQCDSEVLLHALIQWGREAVDRLNGMFAFALWDRREQTMLLGRDRYGIKPLYYARIPSGILFASEQKAFLGHPQFKAQMDGEALLEYFTFQNLFTDKTLLKNVSILPAGTLAELKCGGGGPVSVKFEQYWDFCFEEPEVVRSEEDYLDELHHLLSQAVERQLISDVDVSAYLSGGMDSGSVTAIASKKIAGMRTFTCGFDLSSASGMEINFDERAAAERMSYVCGTEHYEMVLKAGDMERCMPKLAWHLEEPRVGQSYPNFYASHLASKFNKVVLSGTGGDEIFGGYPWRYYRAVVNDDFEHYIDKYYKYWQRLIPNRDIRQVFSPILPDVEHVWTRDIFRNTFGTHADKLTRPEDYVNHSLYLEAKTFLHGLLVVEDKLSMSHSLETRVPFLDNDLVDFAMRLPTRFKLGNLQDVVQINENEPGDKTARYFQKTKDGKLLLRKAMAKFIPQEVADREKQGFSAPDASWFRGESIDYVRRTLEDNNARLWQFLDRDFTQSLVREHLDGKNNRRLLIWSLLNVEQFCQAYL